MTDGRHFFSTRDDPHAQAREARKQPLLLHSMALFREMFEVVFAHREISTVVEIGVESGRVSSVYLELGASTVYCVDPNPTKELRATLAKHTGLQLVDRPSPDVLADMPPADLYVLDGDHNYAVVHAELSWIMEHAPDAVVVLHDVLWPCSRRDLYYEPSPLPTEHRHPSTDEGSTIWHDEMTPAGMVGLGAFTVAREAGGERNGVLTAVEDALAEAGGDEWLLGIVPAVFGMAVVTRKASPGAEKIMDGLRPYTSSSLLASLENNRIGLYTWVLQMQYEAVAHAEHADRLAETVAAQRLEIERLNAERDAATRRRAAEVLTLREEIERLNQQLDQNVRQHRMGAVITYLRHAGGTQLRKTLH